MTLQEIAAQIMNDDKANIYLLYAFNSTGKTRLSVEYKECNRNPETQKQTGVYYNAFSEDLFQWDNDIDNSEQDIKMKIVMSSLNALHSQITEEDVREKLQPYNPKYDFDFIQNEENPELGYSAITFYLKDDEHKMPIKISRAEERIFVWCFFLALFYTDGWANENNKYIFIDDPVSSLDDHNIFVTIFTLIELIKHYYEQKKIIITTHHIGFTSILVDWVTKGELRNSLNARNSENNKYKIYILNKSKDEDYSLDTHKHSVWLYHLRLLQLLDEAIKNDALEIYHAAMLRQLLENITAFIGDKSPSSMLAHLEFPRANELLNQENVLTHRDVYYPQWDIMNNENKKMIKDVVDFLKATFRFVIPDNQQENL